MQPTTPNKSSCSRSTGVPTSAARTKPLWPKCSISRCSSTTSPRCSKRFICSPSKVALKSAAALTSSRRKATAKSRVAANASPTQHSSSSRLRRWAWVARRMRGTLTCAASAASRTAASASAWSAPSRGFAASRTSAKPSLTRVCSTASTRKAELEVSSFK